MGELILMHVGDGRGLVKVAEVARVDLSAPRPPRRFVLFPARAYLHVAERLSNGQLTARWSKHLATGSWYASEGWKRASRRGRLLSATSAEIEALIEGAPTEREEHARLVRLIGDMRERDTEFITRSTVAEFGGVDTIEAGVALAEVLGVEWLARQEAAADDVRDRPGPLAH